MALQLFCDRPLFRKLDLQSARFVVCKWCGVTANGQKYEYGEEIPQGALNSYALECIYEPPLRRVEELNYALTIDGLREAVEARGVTATQEVRPDLDALDRKGLARLCELYGLDATGNIRALRLRLEAHLK